MPDLPFNGQLENDGGEKKEEGGGQPQQREKPIENEIATLKRLLEKQQRENEKLKKTFMSAFSAESEEGHEKPTSYLDKVKKTHNMLKEQHGQGIDLTLEGAEYLQALREENDVLKRQMNAINEPTYVAQRQALWNLESTLREQLEELYGDNYTDSYEDYERVAVETIQKLKENPDEYMKFLRSAKKQTEFVNNVIKKKMPNFDKVPGYQKINLYSYEDAIKDLDRAEQMFNKGDKNGADKLARKARGRMLEEQMSKTIKFS